jgi:putative ABC transport system substrate-binding protein
MQRRDFIITVIAGSATAWPLAAHAQQPVMPAIGYIGIASPEEVPARFAGVRRGLKKYGGLVVRPGRFPADGMPRPCGVRAIR